MSMGIIGKKAGTTQIFDQEGNCVPVTVIHAGPCYVTHIKTMEKDQYSAVQIGFQEVLERKLTLAQKGHLKAAEAKPLKTLREFRVSPEEAGGYSLGQQLDVDLFQPGDYVDVTGTSKGKGFSGVMKRHNFSGAATATHGTHENFRHGGSIGGRYPQHTVKGRKAAGRHGNSRVTVQNLKILQVRQKENLLLIQGALPGAKNSLVYIRKALKKQNKQ